MGAIRRSPASLRDGDGLVGPVGPRPLDQPIHQLAGGVYRRRVPVAVRLQAASEDETIRLARQLVDQGFHSLVVPSTSDMERDVELTRRLCDNAGGGESN